MSWANLCVLSCVLDMVGVVNCANEVCRGWFNQKKIYTCFRERYTNELLLWLKRTQPIIVEVVDLSSSGWLNISCELLRKFVGVKKLIFQHFNNNNYDELIDVISGMVSLEEIDFGICRKLKVESLVRLASLRNLRRIDIWNGVVYDDMMRILCGMEGLNELVLGNCRGIVDKHLDMLSDELQLLNLWNSEITDLGLRRMDKLVELNIGECSGITDVGLKWLEGVNGLRKLCVSYIKNITDEGMMSICEMGGGKICELSIEGCCSVTDRGVGMLVDGLKELRFLNVGRCGWVTDKSVEIITRSKSLRVLGLEMVNITDVSASSLIKSGVEELSISGCSHITDEGINMLFGCSRLKKIISE